MIGGQARAVLITVIFDKAMKLSGRAKAGGKSTEAPPKELKPGSSEEKKWFKKRLGKDKDSKGKPDKAKGVSGDGQGWGNGRIINLMSTDTYRVDQASGMFHLIW
ncbi:ATP-binding cassette transporter yor1, partial [Cryomyces antarcticus]